MIDKRIKYEHGKRVGLRGGGMDMGNQSNQNQSASKGNSSSSKSSSSSSNSSSGGGNDGPRGPSELGTSTRTVNRITAPEAKEYIGGKEYDVTPATKNERDDARKQQTQPTNYDLTNPLASEEKGGFFNTGFGWSDLGMAALFAFNYPLAVKVNKLKKVYDTAKFIGDKTGLYNAKEMKDNLLSQFSNFKGGTTDSNSENQWWASTLTGDNNRGGETISEQTLSPGIEGTRSPIESGIKSLPNASRQDQQSMTFSPRYTRSNVANESEKGIANLKGMGESFADVFKTDTNIPVDGEGSSALLKEYAMLLKQMEQGLLQTEGRERLNILKSRLGLAQGGITNVNMKKNKLGEILHG